MISALAGVAQCIEHQLVNLKVTGSIPSQGTRLGFRPGPWLGACEGHGTMFLYLSLPSALKE